MKDKKELKEGVMMYGHPGLTREEIDALPAKMKKRVNRYRWYKWRLRKFSGQKWLFSKKGWFDDFDKECEDRLDVRRREIKKIAKEEKVSLKEAHDLLLKRERIKIFTDKGEWVDSKDYREED